MVWLINSVVIGYDFFCLLFLLFCFELWCLFYCYFLWFMVVVCASVFVLLWLFA